jgi:Predicted transcriptional regulators
LNPVIVNQEKTIISGHQRYRACLELGIEEVLCDIRIYDDEQQELKDLIETNVRQRGDISSSSLKMGRIIKTLEDCYCIQKGNNQHRVDSANGTTQKDIAEQLGTNLDSYKRAKKLLELIPELQEMLEQGKLSASAGSRILARLSPEEQKEVLEDLGEDGLSEKTQAQLKDYVTKLQAKEKENEELKKKLEEEKKKPKEKELIIEPDIASREELKIVQQHKAELLKEVENLRKQVLENQNQEPVIIKDNKKEKELEEKVKRLEEDLKFKDEIIKDKDNLIKNKDDLIEHTKSLIENEKELQESYKEGYDKYNELINATCDYQSTGESFGKKVGDGIDIVMFLIEVENLLKDKLAPLKYERYLKDVGTNENVKKNVNDLLSLVRGWADEIDSMVNGGDYTSNYGVINNFVDGIIVE